ncbi:hypothetical protein QW131_33055 [Roseibium salinum]|nr:hypothetical protein [Roseibium salinum]
MKFTATAVLVASISTLATVAGAETLTIQTSFNSGDFFDPVPDGELAAEDRGNDRRPDFDHADRQRVGCSGA